MNEAAEHFADNEHLLQFEKKVWSRLKPAITLNCTLEAFFFFLSNFLAQISSLMAPLKGFTVK